MKNFIARNKVFIGAVLVTLVLLFGGIFLLTRNSNSPSTGGKISSDILAPSDSQQTLPSAQVTLVEFGDYQCPACAAYHPILKKLVAEFSGKINFVFRNFPLSQHANANVAAYAAEAAGLQGKFWEMHDKLYETQKSWSGSVNAKDIFIGYAKELGMDVNKFKVDIDSSAVRNKVQKDLNDGNLARVDSTPTFFLDGEEIKNVGSLEDFEVMIKAALLKTSSSSEEPLSYHAHFDLKVYLNGKAVDLSLPQYQSTEDKELDHDIHLHDGNGNVVHVHKKDITLKKLFDSIKITLPAGTVGYVNGKIVENIINYVPQDLDRIVVGNGSFESVTKDACIYSETCPERGKPPTEACVGGLGSNCEE